MIDWEEIARHLYMLLDDCDTADDLAKGDDGLYRNLVRQAHRKRYKWHSIIDPNGDVSIFNQPPT